MKEGLEQVFGRYWDLLSVWTYSPMTSFASSKDLFQPSRSVHLFLIISSNQLPHTPITIPGSITKSISLWLITEYIFDTLSASILFTWPNHFNLLIIIKDIKSSTEKYIKQKRLNIGRSSREDSYDDDDGDVVNVRRSTHRPWLRLIIGLLIRQMWLSWHSGQMSIS